MIMHHTKSWISMAGFLGWILNPVYLSAQDEPKDDQIFELSPFEVVDSGDDRYSATNSVSATQLNVRIQDVPFSLEVVTSEFIKDTGATDFKETLAYSSGIFTNTFIDSSGAGPANGDQSASSAAGVGDRRNNAIVIRGFNAPFQQRMGFRVGTYIGIKGGSTGQGGTGRGGITLGSLIDTVNVDRSEIVRGPGALLYGLGVLSGIVNVLPKQPLTHPHTEISVAVGSHDYFRASFDDTRPIIGSGNDTILSYRAMGAYQEQGDWSTYYDEKRRYGALQLKWTPLRSLSVFGEFSKGKVRMNGHQGKTGFNHYLRDSGSPAWQSPEGDAYRNAFKEAYRWGSEDFVSPFPGIWDTEEWPELWPAWTEYTDTRVDDGLAPLEGPFNQPGFSIYGPDTYYDRVEESALLDIKWTIFKNLNLNVGAFITEQETEELNVTPLLIENNWHFINLAPENDGNELIPRDWVFEMFNPVAPFLADLQIFKGMGSYWTKTPMKGKSEQFKAALSYNFHTPFPGDGANHNFLIGRNDLKDSADVSIGSPNFFEIIHPNFEWNDFLETGQPITEYPHAFRMKSFYDWATPFRYEGQPLVRPGGDYYSTELWYSGHYAVYHGKYFEDRFHIIGGWRNDRYQAREERWKRDWRLHERTGTVDEYYNFAEPIKINTYSFGTNFKLTENISLYAVSAEGVIPNTGQRDGNGDAIAPEQTDSVEFGIKLGYEKLSGTISFFKINRENAIWFYSNAPNPGLWEGGRNPFVGSGNPPDPGGDLAKGVPISYGFNYHLFFKGLVEGPNGNYWAEKLGIQRIQLGSRFILRVPNNEVKIGPDGKFDGSKSPVPGSIVAITRAENIGTPVDDLSQDFLPYVFITYDALKNDPELRAIALEAIEASKTGNYPSNVQPLGFGNSGRTDYVGVNGSAGSGASSTFQEEAKGVDAQIIYSPTRNLQFIFTYAHVEREATSAFNLVQVQDHRHPEIGSFGTEFDQWVLDFGEEAFEDPTDPTTLKGGITGKSLYYGSEDSAAVWGRYSFDEGRLEGFGVGMGARYSGPAQTHVPIGTSGSSVNQYPTPETEANLLMDAALYYMHKFQRFDLRLALNIYNVTDKRRLYSEARYENSFTGEEEIRRTEIFINPRSFRLSCEITF